MKKLLLIAALALTLTGCGEGTETTEQAETSEAGSVSEAVSVEDSQETTETSEEIETGNKIVLGEPFDLGDYKITIHSFKVMDDYDGNPALVYTYDWTNNSDKEAMPFITFSDKAFQNGVETNDDTFMIEGVDLGVGQKEVKSGGTITGAQGFVGIDDINLPLEFEIEESFSFNDLVYTYLIEDLSSL